MELETNTPVSDEERLLAQAKKVTLQPVHASVVADDTPDSVVVAEHLRAGALANASNDVEQDTPLITPLEATDTPATAHNQTKLYVLTGTGIVVLAVVILFVIFGN